MFHAVKIFLLPSKHPADEMFPSYTACAASEAPNDQAMLLMDEPDYPAALWYKRYDLNGSSMWEKADVSDLGELLAGLNWIGQCHYIPYSICTTTGSPDDESCCFFNRNALRKDDKLRELFRDTKHRRITLAQQMANEAAEYFAACEM